MRYWELPPYTNSLIIVEIWRLKQWETSQSHFFNDTFIFFQKVCVQIWLETLVHILFHLVCFCHLKLFILEPKLNSCCCFFFFLRESLSIRNENTNTNKTNPYIILYQSLFHITMIFNFFFLITGLNCSRFCKDFTGATCSMVFVQNPLSFSHN